MIRGPWNSGVAALPHSAPLRSRQDLSLEVPVGPPDWPIDDGETDTELSNRGVVHGRVGESSHSEKAGVRPGDRPERA